MAVELGQESQEQRLRYYQAESTRIAGVELARHHARRRRQSSTASISDPKYWESTAHIVTQTYPNTCRLILAKSLVERKNTPLAAPPLQLMVDFGTASWNAISYTLLERPIKDLYLEDKRRMGRLGASFCWLKGLCKVVFFSVLADVHCYWALRHLSGRKLLPGHLALTASLWLGNVVVRKVAWRRRGRRQGDIRCGECLTLLAQAEIDAIWVSLRQPKLWKVVLVSLLHANVQLGILIAEAKKSESWTTRDVLCYLKLLQPRQRRTPLCVMPEDFEDALDAANCHDLKCPITFSVMVQPVILCGKMYERTAVETWIDRHQKVPHSPDTPAGTHDIHDTPEMDRLLQDFRQEFQLPIEWHLS